MKKFFRPALVAAAVCLGLSSCSTDGGSEDTIVQYPLTGCFARIYDADTQSATYIQSVNYTLLLNYSKATGEINLTGLNLPGGAQYPAITIKDVPAAGVNGWTILSKDHPAVSVTGFGTVPSFRDFTLRLFDRYLGDAYVPGVAISYTVDDRYRVFSAREGQIAVGTTVSTAPDGSSYTNEEAVIGLAFDTKTQLLEIQMSGAQFASNMPAQNIVMSKIPFTMTDAGVANFSIASLVPSIGSTPYPDYPISNLQGSYDFAKGLDLRFTCTLGPKAYDVVADAKY